MYTLDEVKTVAERKQNRAKPARTTIFYALDKLGLNCYADGAHYGVLKKFGIFTATLDFIEKEFDCIHFRYQKDTATYDD